MFVVLLVGLFGLTFVDWDELRGGEPEEESVALADVPTPVRTTIEQEAKVGTLKEIDKTTTNGRTVYAAQIVVNGSEQATRIGEDGKVIDRVAVKKEEDD